MKLLLPRLSGIALLSLLAFGCAAPSASSDGLTDEEKQLLDPEVTQELQGRPSYTVASVAIRGDYGSSDRCAGGNIACEWISVSRENNQTKVWLGDDYGFGADTVWSKNGVILFSTDRGPGDCDDPGCGDVVRVYGVIYPVKVGETWVPQAKVTYEMEFLHPESDEDPEGEVKEVIRFTKQAPTP